MQKIIGGKKMNRKTKKVSMVLSVVLVASLIVSLFGTVAQEQEWKKVPFTEDYDKYPPFFSITQIAPIGNKVREQYTQAVNLEMPKIGIDADFKLLEFGDLINREFMNYYGKTFAEDGFDISSFGWSVGVDPDPFESFHSTAMVPKGSNITYWYCPESDELLSKARVELDQELRKEYLWRWQEIVADEKPYCVVYIPLNMWASVDTLEGFNGLMWTRNYDSSPWSIPGKDTIVYGTPAAVEGMLPWRWNSVYGYYCNANITETLWERDPNLNLVPRCAESATPGPTIVFAPSMLDEAAIEALGPDVNECMVAGALAEAVVFPKYYDIKIKEGIMFHDGTELTTEDVKWSMDACLSPDTAFQGFGTFRDVYSSSEIIDKCTLRIYVGMPHANWVGNCDVPILPKHVYGDLPIVGPEAATAWMESEINKGDKVIGSGPFMFDSFQADQFWKLKKNPNYWGTKYGYNDAGCEFLLLKLIPEREAARVALETGEIDIMDTYYNITVIGEEIEATPGLMTHTSEQFGYQHMHFNCRNPYLANKYVRQAISCCLDRPGIVDSLLGGYGVEGINPVAIPSWAFNTTIQPDPYDLVKARELMDKAGYRYYVLETVVEGGDGEAGTSMSTVAIIGIVALIIGLAIGYIAKRK
jgi:ABC-type transport system substrate-binding protein